MSENVLNLPIWKKNASSYERLSELALLAREKPELFDAFVIVYRELRKNGTWKARVVDHGDLKLDSIIGMLELVKDRLIEDSRK